MTTEGRHLHTRPVGLRLALAAYTLSPDACLTKDKHLYCSNIDP